MIFLKLIGTLLLLLSCSSGYSFSYPTFPENQVTDYSVSADLEEGIYYFSDSTLTAPSGFQSFRLNNFTAPDFSFSSLNEVRLADNYIRHSSFIVPSLDIPDIIFPFHSFL